MRALGVKCKACGHLFGTGILYGVYGRPVVGAASLPCPACHATTLYGRDDYRALRVKFRL